MTQTDIAFEPEDRIVNYVDFFESLDLVLDSEVDDETRVTILDTLNDAIGNNAGQLVWDDDLVA